MKNVVITGVGRGIGKALAEKFLAEGFHVFGTSMTGTADYAHPELTLFKLDLRSAASITEAARAIIAAAQSVGILINNAGVLLDEEETSLKPDLLRDTLAVNMIGAAHFTELMKSAVAGGHIINISSSAGSLELVGLESHEPGHYPAYKISKAALNMYTRTLAAELFGKAIVSSVHPGWVQTSMGGAEAESTPAEAAEGIYNFAISKPATGRFWFRGEELPW
jgi:NAD(P)-dependent dehydrogenase (short-subunit alcohol dehydrogenase family)